MSFYTLDQRSKYEIDITKYQNIEDCPDDFMTKDEVEELLNVDRIPLAYTNKNLAKENFNILYQQAKQEGKKSFIVHDEDLLKLIKYYKDLRGPYCNVRGNKVTILDETIADNKVKAKEAKEQHREMVTNLVNHALRAHQKNTKYELKIGYINRDPIGALILMKQLVSFTMLEFDTNRVTPEKIAKYEHVWSNINIAP